MPPSPSVENAAPAAAAAAPRPALVPEPDAAAADAVAWAEVLAGWHDEARHRADLARFEELEGLATAGRRYRDALAARPGDAIAARFRDEVLKRAVAHGLAALPREAPGHPRAKLAVRIAAGAVIGGLLLAAGIMAARLLPFVSAGARP